jgi:hypothetical protein
MISRTFDSLGVCVLHNAGGYSSTKRTDCIRTSSFKFPANNRRTAYCYKNLLPVISTGDLIKNCPFELRSENSESNLIEVDLKAL